MNPTNRQLLLSRYLYTRGCTVVGGGGIFDAGMAVAHFQDAAEIMLLAAASTLEASVREKSTFEDLWDAVESAAEQKGKPKPPTRTAMRALNKARVNFKHYGECPDRKGAESHRAICGDVLSFIAREYFGREFETISLVDLVSNEREKRQLEQANEALARGDVKSAMECCGEAFGAIADRRYEMHSFGHEVSFPSIEPAVRKYVDGQVSHVRAHVREVETMLFASVCGVSPTDILFLRQMLPTRQAEQWAFDHWPLDAMHPDGVAKVVDLLAQYSIGLSDCERQRERFVPGYEVLL
jgi:hypothetical protein